MNVSASKLTRCSQDWQGRERNLLQTVAHDTAFVRIRKGVYAIRALMGDAPYESIGRPQPSKGAKKNAAKDTLAADGMPGSYVSQESRGRADLSL